MLACSLHAALLNATTVLATPTLSGPGSGSALQHDDVMMHNGLWRSMVVNRACLGCARNLSNGEKTNGQQCSVYVTAPTFGADGITT